MKGGRGRSGMGMGGRGGMMRGGMKGMRWFLPLPIAMIFFFLMMSSGRGMQSPMFVFFVIFAVLALAGGGFALMQPSETIESDEKPKNT